MTDSRWKRAGQILILLAGLVGILAVAKQLPAMVQDYAALAAALLAFGSRWCEQQLPAVKPMGPGDVMRTGVILLYVIVFVASACNPYSVAWRTLDAVQHARALTATQLASTARVKHESCLAVHGPRTDGYRVCIEPTRAMLRHWQREARPAIIASVQITASSLQIAEKVKSDKAVKWLELIRPAVCALARVAKLFSHYLPDSGASIKSVVAMAEGVTCGR